MWQDGLVNCFTQFHNENCPNGFLYFCHASKTLTVSLLQPYLNYDAEWPLRKVKLQYTPHYSSYDIEQKTVTICGSRDEKIDMLPKVGLTENTFWDLEFSKNDFVQNWVFRPRF